jgi:hypothetical protein
MFYLAIYLWHTIGCTLWKWSFLFDSSVGMKSAQYFCNLANYFVKAVRVQLKCAGFNIVTISECDCRWGMGWWIDLLTTYTHHSELQAITALLLISILYLQHLLRLFQPAVSSTSRYLATYYNSGDSSASRAEVLLSQPLVQNSCVLSTQLWRHLFSVSLAELDWTANPQLSTGCPNSPLYNPDTIENIVSNNNSVGVEACLSICCLETSCITLLFCCCMCVCCRHCLAKAAVHRVTT